MRCAAGRVAWVRRHARLALLDSSDAAAPLMDAMMRIFQVVEDVLRVMNMAVQPRGLRDIISCHDGLKLVTD